MRRRIGWIWPAAEAALAGAACALVGAGVWRIGVPGEWQWAVHRAPANGWALVPALVAGAALIGLAAWGAARPGLPRAGCAAILAAMSLAAFGLQQSCAELPPGGAAYQATYVTIAPWVGGYYLESFRVDEAGGVRAYLAGYRTRIAPLAVNDPLWGHLSDHPPGPVLLHWAVNRSVRASSALTDALYPGEGLHRLAERRYARRPLERADLAGVAASALLFRLLAALVVVPAYILGRMAYGPRAGLIGAALAALVPALHVFGPYPDQVQPVIALTVLCLFWRSVDARAGRWPWAAAAGVALFVGLQFTMAFLTLVFTMGAIAALRVVRALCSVRHAGGGGPGPSAGDAPPADRTWRKWAALGLAGAVGVLVPALAVFLLLDYDVVGVWALCLRKHAGFARTFGRTYWKWALFGPVEVALFAGVPVAMAMLRRASRQAAGCFVRTRRAQGGAEAHPFRCDVLLWAVLLTGVALNVSGKGLGEVARLWMFLMPPMAVAAGAGLAEERRTLGWALAGGVMLYQAAAFCAVLDVFGT